MATDKFKTWVKARGVQTVANDCGVALSTVYAWVKGTIVPPDRHRITILGLAKRKLKLGDIVEGY